MIIKEMHLKNFKSFKDERIKMNNFNVILGANASGKSNLMSALTFLRDIHQYGLSNAIAMQGGQKFLTNTKIREKEKLIIEMKMNKSRGEFVYEEKNIDYAIDIKKFSYKLELLFKENDNFIFKEKVTQNVEYVSFDENENDEKEVQKNKKIYGTGIINYVNNNGKVSQKLDTPEDFKKVTKLGNALSIENFPIINTSKNKEESEFLIIQNPFLFRGGMYDFSHFIRNISIYYIDPKKSKKSVQLIGKRKLDEDGGNLALVLNKLLSNKQDKEKLSLYLTKLLPFIKDIEVEKQLDKSIFFKIQEVFQDDPDYDLPSLLLSEGTINVTALVVAMFFEDSDLLCLEEPERNIHPKLLLDLMEMMEDVSKKRQIILTTHNIQIVKKVGIRNVIFLTRDIEGFSRIVVANNNKMIKTFLNNDIGIDEIFLENLIFAGEKDEG